MAFVMDLKTCDAQGLRDYFDHLATQGVWFAEEMAANLGEVEIFQRAELMERTRLWVGLTVFEKMEKAIRNQIHGIELTTDGALGQRTARLNQPYLSDPLNPTPGEGQGLLVHDNRALWNLLNRAADHGSDGMPHGAQYALEFSLFPPHPGQVLTLMEFQAGYCRKDQQPGHIEVEIDPHSKTVVSNVILTP